MTRRLGLCARGALLAAAAALCVPVQAQTPHLRQQGTAKQLVVEGRPFLILGGELSNSAASSEALPDGRGVDILSPFGSETLEADRRAFAAMMAHLREVDGEPSTVVMVQVENEIGMLPVARDYSPLANAAFAEPVPAELVDYLVAHRDTLVPGMRRMWLERGARTHGSWAELFGDGDPAAEVFIAWHFARFADRLAQAGKAEYPLPMFVNVALNRPGRLPGEYPSGGPPPHLLDVWKAGAPTYDFIAPDIYFASFVDIVAGYHRPDNPVGPANAVYAIAAHDALGFAPFSIDSIDDRPGAFAQAYDMLAQLAPFILAAQGTGRMMGFKPRQNYDDSLNFEPGLAVIGDYRFTVAYADIRQPVATPETAGYGGLIIQTGPEDYLIAGQGITVTFEPVRGGSAGIDKAWEGRFEGQRWVPRRLLNGDQTHQGRHIRLPAGQWQIQNVRLYTYR